jgi:hypothetical protein
MSKQWKQYNSKVAQVPEDRPGRSAQSRKLSLIAEGEKGSTRP